MTDQQQEFKEFLERAIRTFGSPDRLARAMGIAPQSIYRAVNEQFTLSLENCLKLASQTAENPSVVLRLAGKGEAADLIESLYGGSRPPLTPVDKALLALRPGIKRQLIAMVKTIESEEEPTTSDMRRRSKKTA